MILVTHLSKAQGRMGRGILAPFVSGSLYKVHTVSREVTHQYSIQDEFPPTQMKIGEAG